MTNHNNYWLISCKRDECSLVKTTKKKKKKLLGDKTRKDVRDGRVHTGVTGKR
jgi:hypothetical protein